MSSINSSSFFCLPFDQRQGILRNFFELAHQGRVYGEGSLRIGENILVLRVLQAQTGVGPSYSLFFDHSRFSPTNITNFQEGDLRNDPQMAKVDQVVRAYIWPVPQAESSVDRPQPPPLSFHQPQPLLSQSSFARTPLHYYPYPPSPYSVAPPQPLAPYSSLTGIASYSSQQPASPCLVVAPHQQQSIPPIGWGNYNSTPLSPHHSPPIQATQQPPHQPFYHVFSPPSLPTPAPSAPPPSGDPCDPPPLDPPCKTFNPVRENVGGGAETAHHLSPLPSPPIITPSAPPPSGDPCDPPPLDPPLTKEVKGEDLLDRWNSYFSAAMTNR